MADVSMKDFLLQYYMQLRFNLMPAEIRAQYDVYAKSNDFRGNMKLWKNKLMHDNGAGRFIQNDLPDPENNAGDYHLTNAEWEKLFKAYQSTVRKMAAARANGEESITENSDTKDFLDEYFGDARTHLFSSAQVAHGYDTELNRINAVFNAHPQVEYVLRQGGYTEPSFTDLKSGIASRKYNTDPNFQSQLTRIIGFLAWKVGEDTNVANWFSGIDLQDIADNAFADNTIDPNKLAYFKRNHQTILNVLYKKDKVFNVFKNYDGGKISSQIDKAREKLKYDDKNSDDYVPPKRDDQLTPMQQLSKWADDTYDNLLDKYLKFHGDRLYFSKNAQFIVKAINGAKIKPTDGIDGVLSKSEDIKKNLLYKSPTATKHFDWFVKTLTEMKATMPKAFAGALKNGRQMRAIISEIIIKAVRDGKVDEAKTTMEVLSVIKYGATTSKVMDALKKEDFTIFSDGKLSWNKNEGVQFVSKALDKSIKAAFMGVGYGITIIGNEIRLSGSKFNGRRGRMGHAQDAWATQNEQDRNARANEIGLQNADANTEIANQQSAQNAINRGRHNPITDANYDTLMAANDRTQQRLSQQANSQRFRDAQNAVNQYNALTAQNGSIQTLQTTINQLQQNKNSLEQQFNDPNTYLGKPQAAADALARQLASDIHDIDQQLSDAQNELASLQNDLNQITNNPDWTRQQQQVTQYNNAKNRADSMRTNLTQWNDARERINELNGQITQRNNELANWDQNHQDKYKELMAYWDMLETGRDSHMGKMYNWLPRGKKSAQTSFDANKNRIIGDYLSNYSYAA